MILCRRYFKIKKKPHMLASGDEKNVGANEDSKRCNIYFLV